MYLKTITLDPASPGIPLPFLVTGLGSDVVLLLAGVPTGFTPALAFKTKTSEAGSAVYGTATESGLFSTVIPGWNFRDAECIHYEITIRNSETPRACFAGRGTLQILDTLNAGSLPNPPPETPMFAVNPVTGLKFPVYAATNADGDTTLTVGQVPLNPPAEG